MFAAPQPTEHVWPEAERLRTSLYQLGILLVTVNVIALLFGWSWISSPFAIAAGALLIDSFSSFERMKGKLEGRVGCGGTPGATSCCAPITTWSMLITAIVFTCISIIYLTTMAGVFLWLASLYSNRSSLDFARYCCSNGYKQTGSNTYACYGGYSDRDCPATPAVDLYIGVSTLIGDFLAVATLALASIAITRLKQLRAAIAMTPLAAQLGDCCACCSPGTAVLVAARPGGYPPGQHGFPPAPPGGFPYAAYAQYGQPQPPFAGWAPADAAAHGAARARYPAPPPQPPPLPRPQVPPRPTTSPSPLTSSDSARVLFPPQRVPVH